MTLMHTFLNVSSIDLCSRDDSPLTSHSKMLYLYGCHSMVCICISWLSCKSLAFQQIPIEDCHAGVTLKRAQILHALHMALRAVSLEALEDLETEKQKKAMDDLLAQKTLVEEHFLLIVQANKGDVERATNFATLYHRSLSSWLDHEVTQLAADVRNLAQTGQKFITFFRTFFFKASKPQHVKVSKSFFSHKRYGYCAQVVKC